MSSKRPIVLLERKTHAEFDNRSQSYVTDENRDSLGCSRGNNAKFGDLESIPQIVESVCRSSRYIGAFLPSFGLQYQLIDETGPLIMTSANLSDLPIIYKDNEMLDLLKAQESPETIYESSKDACQASVNQPKLAGVLLNRREIRMSLDDSVARVVDGNSQVTRRSKGYAPVPIYIGPDDNARQSKLELDKSQQIFATGGQLKSAFAISKGNFSYVSQYFGDLDSVESQKIYETNFYRMKNFFGIEPSLVVCDMHPLYYTSELAESYVAAQNTNKAVQNTNEIEKTAEFTSIPESTVRKVQNNRSSKTQLLKVQHHHAHIGSVMAEHGLSDSVIGVSFDGTGYGTDGNIWGGEFLICEGESFERYSHLKYVDMIGGDSSMKEGWKSAVSHRLAFSNHIGNDVCNRDLINTTSPQDSIDSPSSRDTLNLAHKPEQITLDINDIIDYSIRNETLGDFGEITTVEAAIRNKINTVRTSSMGRLFDAVASLLGIHHVNRYEGECAIMLENAAHEALSCIKSSAGHEAWMSKSHNNTHKGLGNLDKSDLMGFTDINEANILALRFHQDVAKMILDQCQKIREERGIVKVALSGGVFQNKILMELTLELLRESDFQVYYNSAVPPNDGGIALGQNYIGMWHIARQGSGR
jgi:hydrogenase maturation protein HypF